MSNVVQSSSVAKPELELFLVLDEAVPYGVWMSSPDGGLRYASQSFLDLLGMSMEQVAHFGWTKRLWKEEAQGTVDAWMHCIKTGGSWDYEYRILAADGTRRTVLTRGRPVRDDAGQILCWVGINLDVTEHRRLAQERLELLQNAELSRKAAETAVGWLAQMQQMTAHLSAARTPEDVAKVILKEGISLLGGSGGHIWSVENDELLMLHARGYPATSSAHWPRLSLSELLPSTIALRTRTPLWLESSAEVVARFPRINDSRYPFARLALAVVPLFADERPLGAMVLGFEEPHRFSPEQQWLVLSVAEVCAQALFRARLYQQACEARRAREELLAVVSHDLKSPLSAVHLGVQSLKHAAPEGERGDRIRRQTAMIHRAIERMSRLVNDLLDASAIEAGRLSVSLERCDATSLAREALELVAAAAEQKSLKLEEHIPKAPLLTRCDRDRILQVLSNLLGNAVKFTPPGGRVSLFVEDEDGALSFKVIDTGRGIDDAELPHIFSRYWSGRKKAGSDSGLGLYIAQGIVEAHGSRVRVKSRPGEGSEFSFDLPRQA